MDTRAISDLLEKQMKNLVPRADLPEEEDLPKPAPISMVKPKSPPALNYAQRQEAARKKRVNSQPPKKTKETKSGNHNINITLSPMPPSSSSSASSSCSSQKSEDISLLQKTLDAFQSTCLKEVEKINLRLDNFESRLDKLSQGESKKKEPSQSRSRKRKIREEKKEGDKNVVSTEPTRGVAFGIYARFKSAEKKKQGNDLLVWIQHQFEDQYENRKVGEGCLQNQLSTLVKLFKNDSVQVAIGNQTKWVASNLQKCIKSKNVEQ